MSVSYEPMLEHYRKNILLNRKVLVKPNLSLEEEQQAQRNIEILKRNIVTITNRQKGKKG